MNSLQDSAATVTASASGPRLPRPTLSRRQASLGFTLRMDLAASPQDIYSAWTEHLDSWFARPGAINMRAAVDEPFYFETEHAGTRHAHYGRFLLLEPNRLIELTWMTGSPGTEGAETILTVELAPCELGTQLRLTQKGFYRADASHEHEKAWPVLLRVLDDSLADPRPT